MQLVPVPGYPTIDFITKSLGGNYEVIPIPIPLDCVDGFQEAFLEREFRQPQSAWGFLPEGMEEKLVQSLEAELKSGEKDKNYGHFRNHPTFTSALRLIISRP